MAVQGSARDMLDLELQDELDDSQAFPFGEFERPVRRPVRQLTDSVLHTSRLRAELEYTITELLKVHMTRPHPPGLEPLPPRASAAASTAGAAAGACAGAADPDGPPAGAAG